ncbi:putative T7SS-secreted protein [Amycolatopsis sp. NPDC088138]|uniref:putative T7SS-secreted protein n=1 Tax=Amycolatopsis sp. NPDC088138 TaxID=3363938 RepID=UPI003819CF60
MSARDFPALGFDPAPGELDGITDLAGKYRVVSRDLAEANVSLREIVTKQGVWQGDASEAFARRVGPLPGYLDGAAKSMGQAADALDAWCHDLGDLQKRATDLEARAEAAARAAEEARANPDLALANRTFQDQPSLQIAQRLLDNAGSQLENALDGCQNVQDAAKQLLAEHTEAAGRVAELLRKAKELAPDEPDLLDKLGDAVGGALTDLSNTLADSVDEVGNFVQDHAEVISKVSDVTGDLGNMLGIVSDCLPPPADIIVGAIATGLGAGALEGHLVAKAAGADVAPETLTFDALGAVTSLVGAVPGVSETVAKAVTFTGWGLLGEQVGGELAADGMGKKFEGPLGDLEQYWVPKDAVQWSVVAASPAGVAYWNAVDAGTKADNAPDRRRERAEDEVWN